MSHHSSLHLYKLDALKSQRRKISRIAAVKRELLFSRSRRRERLVNVSKEIFVEICEDNNWTVSNLAGSEGEATGRTQADGYAKYATCFTTKLVKKNGRIIIVIVAVSRPPSSPLPLPVSRSPTVTIFLKNRCQRTRRLPRQWLPPMNSNYCLQAARIFN